MRAWSPVERARGLTLVEVLIATTLFTVVTLAAAHLLVWATRALWFTAAQTVALAAAQAKLEQLESLAWHFDADGNAVSDFETNLSGEVFAGGGPGLTPSPPNALIESLDGYSDYLDADGRWVGTGGEPPGSAMYVRRWAVRPLGTTSDTLVLQVLVAPLANAAGHGHPSSSGEGESLLTTARTRVR